MPSNAKNLFLSFVQLSGKLLKRMDANLSIHGISFTEYQILLQLNSAEGQSLPRIELANRIGLSASGVTRLIAPMEKLGMVQKESHPRDARMSLVKLTKAGLTIYQESSDTVSLVASEQFDPLTESQLKALDKVLIKLN